MDNQVAGMIIMEFQHPNALRKKYDFMAKKSFGQNFLVHTPTLKTISEKILIYKPASILEIGPGPGSLSQCLAPHVQKMLLVEKDPQFSALLEEILVQHYPVQVVTEDFLTCNINALLDTLPKPLFAVGNLPYYVSVPILKKLLQHKQHFQHLFLMFQKEVADRICAKPNSKAYGSLSLYVQFLAQAKLLQKIPPSAFDPRPKIDSAIVHLTPHQETSEAKPSLEQFEKVIQAAFAQRRKTLLNCLLAAGYFEGNKEKGLLFLKQQGLPEKVRAESLDLKSFSKLALALM